MADIVIGGRLHSAATGNTVAGANEIMDDAQGKKQSVVNQELANRISVAGQQQQAAIEAEAEARAAKDRELKALIDQGIIEGGGIVFDTEPTPDSVNPVTSNGIAGTLGYNIDNVEFVRVVVDAQNRVVFGIQHDGNVYFGAGVPEQIQTYVRDMMATIDLTDITTTLEQITDYLAGKLGTQLTLSEELNGKVDKEEGKSLIDAEVAESFSTADNPEYVKAVTDSEGKLLAGIKKDGKVWMNDLEVDGKAFYDVTDSPEWLKVVIDSDGKVIAGIRKDGSTYIANLDTGGAIAAMLAEFEERMAEIEDDIDTKMALFNAVFSEFTDPEGRIQITTDADNKVLSYRDKDGVLHETNLVVDKKLELSDEAMDDFQQALKDSGFSPDNSKKYAAPYLPSYGTINVKTETFYLTAHPNVHSIDDVELRFDFADTEANAADRMTIAHYYVKNTNTRLQHYASGKVTLNTEDNKYYAKDPIRKVNGVCYYADSLGFQSSQSWVGSPRTKVISGYTRTAPDVPELAEGAVVQSLVEVIEITGPCCVNAWTIEDWEFHNTDGADIGKKYEHKCIADIDFGGYLTVNNATVTLKGQGNSTMGLRKRNYRLTFYKNSSYSKKDKIKIGEMLRLSKFNVKANFNDNSRIKENILYRIFIDIWNSRPITDRYNWDNEVNGIYHGATGNIQCFPVKLMVANSFYGIYNFALPKDASNYIFDDKDEDTGMLLCGAGGNTDNNWGVTLPYDIPGHYDSEMDSDDLSDYPGILAALEEWHHFINSRLYKGSDDNLYNSTELTEVEGTMYVTSTLEDGNVVPTSVSAKLIKFSKDNIPYRLDVLGFIDYFICLQVFLMDDNLHHNMMFYSDGEKKKIFPFFYDLDNAIRIAKGTTFDIFDTSTAPGKDLSLWNNLKDIYWDNIINRYCELRKTVLSVEYITSVYTNIKSGIPDADYASESAKWGGSISASNFETLIAFLSERIDYLDNNYFHI